MTDDDLLAFAAEFREGILDGRSSWMMCFAVSAPLATLLRLHGVDVELVEGDLGEFNHVWLRLSDGRVLDPTADQFNDFGFPPLPPVYLGPPTGIHPPPAAARRSAGVRMLRKQLEGACADCGRRYGDAFGFPDLIIPDDAWKAISPRGDEGGLLCPSCICRRLHEAGIKTTGRFTSGPLCDDHSPPGEAPAADLPVRNARPRE